MKVILETAKKKKERDIDEKSHGDKINENITNTF